MKALQAAPRPPPCWRPCWRRQQVTRTRPNGQPGSAHMPSARNRAGGYGFMSIAVFSCGQRLAVRLTDVCY